MFLEINFCITGFFKSNIACIPVIPHKKLVEGGVKGLTKDAEIDEEMWVAGQIRVISAKIQGEGKWE